MSGRCGILNDLSSSLNVRCVTWELERKSAGPWKSGPKVTWVSLDDDGRKIGFG